MSLLNALFVTSQLLPSLSIQKDSRALGFCTADACCQNKTDEAGRRSCTFGVPNRAEYREENPRCGPNGTCSPSVCTCFANGIFLFNCTIPYDDICNGVADANGTNWGFEGCVRDYPGYPDFQRYQQTASCEVARCVVDGGTYGSCYCQMYHSLCKAFGDARTYNVSQGVMSIIIFSYIVVLTDSFWIPTRQYNPEAPGHCVIDSCCQTKTDEDGRMSCLGILTSPVTIEYPNITATDAVGDPPVS